MRILLFAILGISALAGASAEAFVDPPPAPVAVVAVPVPEQAPIDSQAEPLVAASDESYTVVEPTDEDEVHILEVEDEEDVDVGRMLEDLLDDEYLDDEFEEETDREGRSEDAESKAAITDPVVITKYNRFIDAFLRRVSMEMKGPAKVDPIHISIQASGKQVKHMPKKAGATRKKNAAKRKAANKRKNAAKRGGNKNKNAAAVRRRQQANRKRANKNQRKGRPGQKRRRPQGREEGEDFEDEEQFEYEAEETDVGREKRSIDEEEEAALDAEEYELDMEEEELELAEREGRALSEGETEEDEVEGKKAGDVEGRQRRRRRKNKKKCKTKKCRNNRKKNNRRRRNRLRRRQQMLKQQRRRNQQKGNRNKRSAGGSPGTIHGLSKLRRSGNVRVMNSMGKQTLVADVNIGPVVMRTQRKMKATQTRKSSTLTAQATAPNVRGKLVISINQNGKATVNMFKTNKPKTVQVTGKLNRTPGKSSDQYLRSIFSRTNKIIAFKMYETAVTVLRKSSLAPQSAAKRFKGKAPARRG